MDSKKWQELGRPLGSFHLTYFLYRIVVLISFVAKTKVHYFFRRKKVNIFLWAYTCNFLNLLFQMVLCKKEKATFTFKMTVVLSLLSVDIFSFGCFVFQRIKGNKMVQKKVFPWALSRLTFKLEWKKEEEKDKQVTKVCWLWTCTKCSVAFVRKKGV